MGKIKDITGQRFGRLVALEISGKEKNRMIWRCRCDCGNEVNIPGTYLRSGHTQSCGCIHREQLIERNSKHGLISHRLYTIWCAMKQRCYYKNSIEYYRYGGRGIRVCEEWLNDFQAFYDWAIANGYRDDLSIDRINPDGNYEPSNCKWSTPEEQANNKSQNIRITVNGETHTPAEWSRITGANPNNIRDRIHRGYAPEEAIKNTNNNLHIITINGESHTIKEWGEKNNINQSTILHRLKRGWSEERAVTTPAKKARNTK